MLRTEPTVCINLNSVFTGGREVNRIRVGTLRSRGGCLFLERLSTLRLLALSRHLERRWGEGPHGDLHKARTEGWWVGQWRPGYLCGCLSTLRRQSPLPQSPLGGMGTQGRRERVPVIEANCTAGPLYIMLSTAEPLGRIGRPPLQVSLIYCVVLAIQFRHTPVVVHAISNDALGRPKLCGDHGGVQLP